MTWAAVVWGSPRWLSIALAVLGVAAVVVLWSYARARASGRVRLVCAALKGAAFAALALSLAEPLLTGSRPRRGANAFAIVVDDSQSLRIKDGGATATRGDWVARALRDGSDWQTRLGQDFDVRRYTFDSHLRAVDHFDTLEFNGDGTAVGPALEGLARRFRGLPLAGVLLVTDGNRTDLDEIDVRDLPPVYPVAPPARGVARDLGVTNVSVSQANFEAAPVVVRADVNPVGYRNQSIVVVVEDEEGREVDRQSGIAQEDGRPLNFRFQFRPVRQGVNFYTVRAFAERDATSAAEQTTANNARLVVVDQGGGPYRVLYVSGRPNWEFKFLRRAVAEDEQVNLVGLIRIAKKQPKFDFQRAGSDRSSALFEGFDNPDEDTAEAVDEPVIVRLGTVDEAELRGGFPDTAEDLYAYHAIILDDLESGFFTQDQLALLRNFVSVRGGGLLMLGGPDSFAEGEYDRTPVGELLPVYLARSAVPAPPGTEYRLVLTREGWLQPWVRTRKTEDEERSRLAGMAPFRTLNRAGALKPGASVLANVEDAQGNTRPALAVQRFGKGHVAALLVGDLWRWGLRRADPSETDFDRAWRQTVRWLVGDVPGRLEVAVRPKPDAPSAFEVTARVRDAEFRPLDNAEVQLRITRPDGEELTLHAAPDDREGGLYSATYAAREPGAYRIAAAAKGPDGAAIGSREAGWAAQPAAEEFARLEPDRAFLESLAAKTGGEVVDGQRLESFVSSLSSRGAPITEPWTSPLWHQPLYFLAALACLAAEWGLRRISGLS